MTPKIKKTDAGKLLLLGACLLSLSASGHAMGKKPDDPNRTRMDRVNDPAYDPNTRNPTATPPSMDNDKDRRRYSPEPTPGVTGTANDSPGTINNSGVGTTSPNLPVTPATNGTGAPSNSR